MTQPLTSKSSLPAAGGGGRNPGLRWTLTIARFAFPAAAIAYLLSIVPIRKVLRSASAMPLSAVAAAVSVLVLSSCVGTYRWRLLFATCGVPGRPRYLEMLRAYWIGVFYNTCVPGGLGGEVVRGIATRRAMGPRGLPAALAIVFLDRTAGLTGMLILLATSFTLFPLPGIPHVVLFSGLGVCVAAGAVTAIVSGPRIAPFLPAPFARIAAALPTIESLPLFAAALGLSVLTQLLGVAYGHVLMAGIAPEVAFKKSLVILPLVNTAQYFPLTVGGAGVREAGFVLLYAMAGVAKADALAASLVYGALAYVVSAFGGVLHLLKPLTLDDAGDTAEASSAAGSASQP